MTLDQVIDASCADAADGEIYITISGGTPQYGSNWTGPNGFNAQIEDISGLAPGSYTLTVTDANNCIYTLGVTVDALVTVVADAGLDQSECAGVAITLDGSGSTGAVTYEWRDDQNNIISNAVTADPGSLGPGWV